MKKIFLLGVFISYAYAPSFELVYINGDKKIQKHFQGDGSLYALSQGNVKIEVEHILNNGYNIFHVKLKEGSKDEYLSLCGDKGFSHKTEWGICTGKDTYKKTGEIGIYLTQAFSSSSSS